MFNRTYQIRARQSVLQGQQLDIGFPIRGRPTRRRTLEKCGQMRLNLQPAAAIDRKSVDHHSSREETFDQALELTFPEREPPEDELAAEFDRLFPPG